MARPIEERSKIGWKRIQYIKDELNLTNMEFREKFKTVIACQSNAFFSEAEKRGMRKSDVMRFARHVGIDYGLFFTEDLEKWKLFKRFVEIYRKIKKDCKFEYPVSEMLTFKDKATYNPEQSDSKHDDQSIDVKKSKIAWKRIEYLKNKFGLNDTEFRDAQKGFGYVLRCRNKNMLPALREEGIDFRRVKSFAEHTGIDFHLFTEEEFEEQFKIAAQKYIIKKSEDKSPLGQSV